MGKFQKKLIFGIVLIGLFCYLASLFYIGTHATLDNHKASDAVVVLGARVKVEDTYSPCLYYRVDHGIALWRSGAAKKIIFSGGGAKKMPNEAHGMLDLALSKGVTRSAILLEDTSKTTYENLLFTKQLMQRNNLHSIIIVSDPYHLPRAELVAKKLGIDATVSPTFQSPCWYRFTYFSPYFLREGLALLYYLALMRI